MTDRIPRREFEYEVTPDNKITLYKRTDRAGGKNVLVFLAQVPLETTEGGTERSVKSAVSKALTGRRTPRTIEVEARNINCSEIYKYILERK